MRANHHPGIRGTDHAIWRRIHLIPFTVTILPEERDGTLPERLRNELPGVLRWAVEGCSAWIAGGRKLQPPQAMTEAVAEYRQEQDTLGSFMAERCQLGNGYEVNATDLYRAYVTWCVTNHEGKPMSNTALALEMQRRGFTKRIVNGRTYRQGFRLLGGGLVDDDDEG